MRIKDSAIFNSVARMLSVHIENLLALPCHVFCKNIDNIYTSYNDYGAANLGYGSGLEIAGKTDYTIFAHSIAEQFIKNDQDVLAQKQPLFFSEPGTLKDNALVTFHSHKIPLYDQDENLVGILGLAFPDNKVINLIEEKPPLPPNPSPRSSLSTQEKECLHYLCQGLTLKSIAKQMMISPKTVETYIERAKIKMNCRNKAQLILTFIKSPL